MHLLTLCILLLFAAIDAATHGDWSGIEAIVKVISVVVFMFVLVYIAQNPKILLIVIALIVISVIGKGISKRK